MFYAVPETIYRKQPQYRTTEEDITRLLLEGPTVFHQHATVIPYLLFQNGRVAGRFALIQDRNLSGIVQVSFFEAESGLIRPLEKIQEKARAMFPDCGRMVVGLNGHINYGAGFLTERFDLPPLFGLPYTSDYYRDYFQDLKSHQMVTYRFPVGAFCGMLSDFAARIRRHPVRVRMMNKKKLKEDLSVYTALNNACFEGHPFWATRLPEEDFELFHPFRFLIKEENLLFAEINGKPAGFLLWYPDFNQMLNSRQHLGIRHVLLYHGRNPIDTFRLTQIAVLPEYRRMGVELALYHALSTRVRNRYAHGEGGFIFGQNVNSILMSERYIKRATGINPLPYRRFSVYETALPRVL
ncbi:GNAT family N-acetyltransferase [bacterium]|nr:GNAT family N-acetyltransferase [bacterium]